MTETITEWFRNSRGNMCKRAILKPRGWRYETDLATPMVIADFSEPVQSMADGKFYNSKRALAESHKAHGNPQGVEYRELGTEAAGGPMKEVAMPTKAQDRDTIKGAMQALKDGWRPDVASIDL